jgi:MFS family permease
LVGFVNTSYSTLERRFHFTSTTTGIISGFNNLGSLLAIIPLSHLADRSAFKLRYIALGLFIIGLGSVLFCLPHFIAGPVERKSVTSEPNVCTVDLKSDVVFAKSQADEIDYSPFFMMGHFFHGAGASCIFPVGAAFLQTVVPDKPMAIAIWTTLFVIGPALGYVMNGLLLKVDTDFYRQSSVALDAEEDGQWIGAWVRSY